MTKAARSMRLQSSAKLARLFIVRWALWGCARYRQELWR